MQLLTSVENHSKKKTLIATEQKRKDVVEQRKEWKQFQSIADETKLVFIDETWAKTNMTTLYGWAPMGRHVVDGVSSWSLICYFFWQQLL